MRVGNRTWPLWIQYIVDNVYDAISNQDVGGEELGRVDVDVVSGVEDGNVCSVLSEEFGAVGEAWGVDDLGDDGVVHDLSELV